MDRPQRLAREASFDQTGPRVSTEQGLDALMTEPTSDPRPNNWKGPYLRKAVPKDPWGNAYSYLCPGDNSPQGYDLLSYGADGQAGGEGEDVDITNWN